MNALTRRQFLQLLGLSTAGAMLASCAPQAVAPTLVPTLAPAVAPTAKAVRTRPIIRLGASPTGTTDVPQPFAYQTGLGYVRSSLTFDELVGRDSTAEPIPWLAEKFTSSEDGTDWTFTLRNGVTFHDGQPLTIDDVLFSFQ